MSGSNIVLTGIAQADSAKGAHKLDVSFFMEDTRSVAKHLLGKILVHIVDGARVAGRIIETEAYLHDDPACHASLGKTKRNATMFSQGGISYVYFTYGVHHCLNFVTGPENRGEGCLIRALFPLDGMGLMQANRGTDDPKQLCSGPGKLTQALGIDLRLNATSASSDELYLLEDGFEVGEIVERPRIGISKACDKLWRFYPANFKDWVSRV